MHSLQGCVLYYSPCHCEGATATVGIPGEGAEIQCRGGVGNGLIRSAIGMHKCIPYIVIVKAKH